MTYEPLVTPHCDFRLRHGGTGDVEPARHEVVLLERAEECKAVSAGFLLQPIGMGVLEEIGILEAVLAHDPVGKVSHDAVDGGIDRFQTPICRGLTGFRIGIIPRRTRKFFRARARFSLSGPVGFPIDPPRDKRNG